MTQVAFEVDWVAVGTVASSLALALAALLTVRHQFVSSSRKDRQDTTNKIQAAKVETNRTLAEAESSLRSDLMRIVAGLQKQVAEQTDRWLACESRHGQLQVVTASLEAKNIQLSAEIGRLHVDGERNAQRIDRVSARVDTATAPVQPPSPPVVIVQSPPPPAAPVVVAPVVPVPPSSTGT